MSDAEDIRSTRRAGGGTAPAAHNNSLHRNDIF
jgi:hypothetical protein